MIRIAINGFGRIGRNAFKVALEYHKDVVEVVAINDLTEPKVLAHLLKYDTAYGAWDREISADEHNLIVDGKSYPIHAEKEPAKLPWKDLNVDVVIESTGRFTDADGMKQHLEAGARIVVLSAPSKGDGVGTFLIGVNHDKYSGETLINNASCTSNCIAPVIAVLEDKFGVEKGLYTTVHSVTAEQNLVDGPPPGGKTGDLRRARAAYTNMIPTTTGAAIAVTQAITSLKDKLDGRAIRVPTITGSITDFTVVLKRKTSVEEVNQAFKDAAALPRWQGILATTEEPIVSSDIIGRSESSIVDLALTQLIDGDLLKVFAWYDNEWGYSNRLIEQVINVGMGLNKETLVLQTNEEHKPELPAEEAKTEEHADAASPVDAVEVKEEPKAWEENAHSLVSGSNDGDSHGEDHNDQHQTEGHLKMYDVEPHEKDTDVVQQGESNEEHHSEGNEHPGEENKSSGEEKKDSDGPHW